MKNISRSLVIEFIGLLAICAAVSVFLAKFGEPGLYQDGLAYLANQAGYVLFWIFMPGIFAAAILMQSFHDVPYAAYLIGVCVEIVPVWAIARRRLIREALHS